MKKENIELSNYHEFNLHSAHSQDAVDKINKSFYGRFNFPWYPSIAEKFNDQSFSINMLNQDIGSWDHSRIQKSAKIWVAGCGTNQAVLTALKYPESEITGTDISVESLAAARALAEKLNVTNLKLEEKSINDVTYKDEFDYIICTGVIHHNANPQIPLEKLSNALKKNGIMELFVYNYYRRILNTAFQKAIRLICTDDGTPNIDLELPLTNLMINNSAHSCSGLMQSQLFHLKGAHECDIADKLLQPVEHSYTVETFDRLVQECQLQIVSNCICSWDKVEDALSFEMKFHDKELAEKYESLPDITRWKIGNLLLLEESPNTWFYLQKKESDFAVKDTHQINAEFLDTVFEKTKAKTDLFVRNHDDSYLLATKGKSYPQPEIPTNNIASLVFNRVDGKKTVREILSSLGTNLGFYELNDLRMRLTTTAFPYLVSIKNKI
ncbi:class I SAM-dependent methyltransferase [Pleionea litopenaei]|uniref:Class I SAM-dependent methyltransferase n=1 Tax=Pleionea litopenaei TaxID=3070815 RepID=A0AA51RTJ7_9GAMM|nr:class I SAM-dependent methyltransferase [Pleionea sp. HL-JVS1]WMS87330.1 class I SAM-dependent methyltransferase [Pleionea sp. HL-JVS1]